MMKMTKTGKRIIAVSILLLTVLLVGCLLFTGNQLADVPKDFKEYKSILFEGKDGTMVAFTEENAQYDTVENDMIVLDLKEYADGVITMEKQDKTYVFVVIGKDMLYDVNTNQILTRRGAYD